MASATALQVDRRPFMDDLNRLMKDPFAANSNSSMLRDAQMGLLLVAVLLCVFVYVAYYRIAGKGRQLPEHVRMAPVAQAVWPNSDPPAQRSLVPSPTPRNRPIAPALAAVQPTPGIQSFENSPAKQPTTSPNSMVAKVAFTEPAPNSAAKPSVTKIDVDPPVVPPSNQNFATTRNQTFRNNQWPANRQPVNGVPRKLTAAPNPFNALSTTDKARTTPAPDSTLDLKIKPTAKPTPSISPQITSKPTPKATRLPSPPNPLIAAPKSKPTTKPNLPRTAKTQPKPDNAFQPATPSERIPTQRDIAKPKRDTNPPKPRIAARSKPIRSVGPQNTAVSNDHPVHAIQRGDSFWSLASQHYGDGRYFHALFEWNQTAVQNFDDLPVGTQIEIPNKNKLRNRHPNLCPDEQPFLSSAAFKPQAIADYDNSLSERLYITRSGDTLFGIAAQKLGQASRYLEILTLNDQRLPVEVRQGSPLKPGLRLVLPE